MAWACRRGNASIPMIVLLVGVILIVAGGVIARPMVRDMGPNQYLTVADVYTASDFSTDEVKTLRSRIAADTFILRAVGTRTEYKPLLNQARDLWQPDVRVIAMDDQLLIQNDVAFVGETVDPQVASQLQRDVYAYIEYEIGSILLGRESLDDIRRGVRYLDAAVAINPKVDTVSAIRDAMADRADGPARLALLAALGAAKSGDPLTMAVNESAASGYGRGGL